MTLGFFQTLFAVNLFLTAMQAITSFIICKPTAQLHRFRFMTIRGAKQRSGGEGKAPKKANTAFVSIEYVDSELWKLEPIIDILKKGDAIIHLKLQYQLHFDALFNDMTRCLNESLRYTCLLGGVGVIPTDTCYSFVTSVSSKEGNYQ